MKILSKIVASLLVALASGDADAAQKAHGILIYVDRGFTPDEYAIATEFISAEMFPTVVNFVTPDGSRLSVVNGLVRGRVDFDGNRPEAFPEILQEKDIAPIEAAIKDLDGVRFPKSRKYLDPLVAELKQEIARFRQGQGKWGGRWYASLKMALEERGRPLRLAAAEREKQAALAKAQADQMEAAARKRAADIEAATAAELTKAEAFRTRVSAILGKLLVDKSWTGRVEDLSKITSVSPELKIEIERVADDGKNLRAGLQYPDSQQVYDKTIPSLEVARAWSQAAQFFAAGESAQGTAVLREFLAQYSAASNPELSPLWDPLLAFFKFCQVQEEGAQAHFRKAQGLSAAGKNSQAITEYQTANTLFPNREIQTLIEKLRKDSLGL